MNHCHICIYWTPETGCKHYKPEPMKITLDQNVEATYEPTSSIFKFFKTKLAKWCSDRDCDKLLSGPEEIVNGIIVDSINHVFTIMDDNQIAEITTDQIDFENVFTILS